MFTVICHGDCGGPLDSSNASSSCGGNYLAWGWGRLNNVKKIVAGVVHWASVLVDTDLLYTSVYLMPLYLRARNIINVECIYWEWVQRLLQSLALLLSLHHVPVYTQYTLSWRQWFRDTMTAYPVTQSPVPILYLCNKVIRILLSPHLELVSVWAPKIHMSMSFQTAFTKVLPQKIWYPWKITLTVVIV